MKSIEELITKLDKLKEAKRLIELDIFNCENDIKNEKTNIEKQYRSYVGKKAMVETTLGSKIPAICTEVKLNDLFQIRPFFSDLKGNRISINTFNWI